MFLSLVSEGRLLFGKYVIELTVKYDKMYNQDI